MCTYTRREGGHVHTIWVITQTKEMGIDGANDTELDGNCNPVFVNWHRDTGGSEAAGQELCGEGGEAGGKK
jgi:hypothetical protein